MTTRTVPTDYATVQEAITACVANDIIEIESGTYSGALSFTAKGHILMRAAEGATVILTHTAKVLSFATAAHNISIVGLTIRLTGTSTTESLIGSDSNTLSIRFVDCIFDTSTMTGTAGTVMDLIDLRAGSSTSPTLVRRCKFTTGSNKTWLRFLRIRDTGVAGETVLVECNLFSTPNTPNNASACLVEVSTTGAGSHIIVRNNSFYQGSISRMFVSAAADGAGNAGIYNNVGSETVLVRPTDLVYMFTATGGSTHVSHNSVNNTGAYTVRVASPDTSDNEYVTHLTLGSGGEPRFDSAGDQSYGYALYQNGSEQAFSERRATRGVDGKSFCAGSPSRGCFEIFDYQPGVRALTGYHAGGASLLHVKHKYLDPTNGVTFATPAGAIADFLPTAKRFDSPFELAAYVERQLSYPRSQTHGPLEFWYDIQYNRYRISFYLSTYDLTCSGMSASLFGTQTITAGTANILASDPHTALLEYALDTDPVGDMDGSISNRAPTGYMYGEGVPDDSALGLYAFRGLSSKEALTPGESEASLRRILTKYYIGGEVRIYRTYPEDLTPHQEDPSVAAFNLGGYTDMVPLAAAREITFGWGDDTSDRFEFDLEGVEAR